MQEAHGSRAGLDLTLPRGGETPDDYEYDRRIPPARLAPEDAELIREAAGALLEITPELAVAMARHVHKEVPELGGIDDADAVETTRASCEGNVREILIMQRAGLPATAHETPAGAREYATFIRRAGVGLQSALRGYLLGVAFFQPIVQHEFERRAKDPEQLDSGPRGGTGVPLGLHRPRHPGSRPSTAASRSAGCPAPRTASGRAPRASAPPRSSRSRSRGGAQRPPLGPRPGHRPAGSLRRDGRGRRRQRVALPPPRARRHHRADRARRRRGPRGHAPARPHPDRGRERRGRAEVSLTIASIDLDRLWLDDFHLPMAIVRGRVLPHGPVRKFLRVMPIVRGLDARLNDPDPGDDVAAVAQKID